MQSENLNKFFKILNWTISKNNDLYYYLKFLKNKIYFLKLIENNDINKLKDILSKIIIKEFENNDVIFFQDDIASNFYFILKGKVNIYINSKISKNDFSKNFYNKHKNNPKIYNKDWKQFIINKVNVFEEGGFFGELGILNNSKRKATVISKLEKNKSIQSSIWLSKEDEKDFLVYKKLMKSNKVIMGIIQKENFTAILKNQWRMEQENKLKHIFNLFHKEIIFKKISNIFPYLKECEYKKKNFIFKKNDPYKFIYIISKGEIKLTENITINKIKDYNELDYSKNYKKYLKLKIQKSLNYGLDNKSLKYDVRYLKEGEYLGINEYLNNLDFYEFNAEVYSDKVTLFELNISNLKTINNNIFNLKEYFKKYNINFQNYDNRKIKLKNIWNKNIKAFNINKLSINLKENKKLMSKKNINNQKFYSRRINTNYLKNLNINKILNKYDKKNFIFDFNKKNKRKYTSDKKNNNSKENTAIFLNSINSNYLLKKCLKKGKNGEFSLKKSTYSNKIIIKKKKPYSLGKELKNFKNYFLS